MKDIQEFQFYDKYSRWNYELGRRENWEEAVTRASNFLKELSENKLPESDYKRIHEAMLNMESFSSMRLFAMAGKAGRRNNLSLYNCSALGIDSIDAFCEVLLLSMSGCGVGFSVEERYISQLPLIPPKFARSKPKVFVIDDSTEGWVEALRTGLSHWFNGKDISFDYTQIREAGAVLKTKGGRSSGHKPLKELLDYTRKTIRSAKGSRLSSLQIHDIVTKIADCVVSGGVRRSALISMFPENDKDLLHSKDYGWWKEAPQRSNANNSVLIDRKLPREQISCYMHLMNDGGGGEPGLIFRNTINRMNPQRRKNREDWITNPCQPGWATVLTPEGIRTFDDIDVGDLIWGDDGWTRVVRKVNSGVKPVFEYTTSFGNFVGTEEHRVVSFGKKVEVKDAEKIDVLPGGFSQEGWNLSPLDIMDGLVIGDGSVHKASNNLVLLYIGKNDKDYYESEIRDLLVSDRTDAFANADHVEVYEIETSVTHDELPRTWKRTVPDRYFYGTPEKAAGFLRGIYSANGSVVANGDRVTLKQTSYALIKDVQVMLSSLGIRSYVTTNRAKDIAWDNGDYKSRESYDLNITMDREIFLKSIGFIQNYKNKKISPVNVQRVSRGCVTDVSYLGEEDVYDITVDNESHTYWSNGLHVSNCGEIVLRPMQLCNLSQAILRPDDTFQTLAEKVRIATIIGTIQATATHFPGMRSQWKENCEEERLLGVDITGQMDNPELLTEENFRRLLKIVVDTNRDYAKILGINPAAAVTCVKPSGNSSILFDCSSGLHSQWSDYYIRRIRVNADSPMRKVLEKSGFKLDPENGQKEETATTFVASFPVAAPDGAITNGSRSALEQLEWWKRNKVFWTEHNPSCTISYKPEELEEMIDWLYENQSIIGGLSFLLKDDHVYPLAPYEKISKDSYNKLVSETRKIDFSYLEKIEHEDRTKASQELACFGGVCEI
jgi:hypothetical protein